MSLLVLLGVPLAGAVALRLLGGSAARAVHLVTAAGTLGAAGALAVAVGREEAVTAFAGLLRADALSAWMAGLVALVAALAAVEAPAAGRGGTRSFYPLFHLFVFTMLLAVTTDDVGLMWVAIEGSTLASVFLVNFERTRASLEASYKYLLICSVGIGIAFAGTVLVYFAETQGLAGPTQALRWTALLASAPGLPVRVVELAFVFLLVGYGTKAGLVPMHTWLPDAHSEAPASISALMSGVLLAVGLYAVLRFKAVTDLAAGPEYAGRLLIGLGLASMAIAAAFLTTPRDYKRMLAYSSVEHIGIACLGLGFGGAWGVAGALLHVANHGLVKSTLFLLAGRVRRVYGSSDLARVRGLLRTMPLTGRAFLAAMLALVGLPPFGLFVSEIMIFGAGFQAGVGALALLGLGFLVIAFAGLLRATHGMLYGESSVLPAEPVRSWPPAAVPVGVALLLLVLTGTAWPPGLALALERIAAVVGVH